MTKALKKAIATRSCLENRYYKSIESKLACKKQRRLYKKERKTYYTKLDITNITDNRKFWKTMKPFFSDKGVNTCKITLIEDNKIISDDDRVAETLKSFFELTSAFIVKSIDNVNPNDVIIGKYACHASILQISKAVINQTFLFQYVELSEVDEEIMHLKTNSASDPYGIPSKIIKLYSNICNEPLKDIANIIPLHKKDETTKKSNYRPISVLVVAKLIERILHNAVVISVVVISVVIIVVVVIVIVVIVGGGSSISQVNNLTFIFNASPD